MDLSTTTLKKGHHQLNLCSQLEVTLGCLFFYVWMTSRYWWTHTHSSIYIQWQNRTKSTILIWLYGPYLMNAIKKSRDGLLASTNEIWMSENLNRWNLNKQRFGRIRIRMSKGPNEQQSEELKKQMTKEAVRTCKSCLKHVSLWNWLILWQNTLYLYLGRSRMGLILQGTRVQV